MARLADMIHFWKWYPPLWTPSPKSLGKQEIEEFLKTSAQLKKEISNHPVIVADNVSEYLYAGTDQEVWDFTTDFPCCIPPFEACFVEMKRPSTIRSVDPEVNASVDFVQNASPMWGWFCECQPIDQAAYAEQTDDLPTIRARVAATVDFYKSMVDPQLIATISKSADPHKAYESLNNYEKSFIQAKAILAQIDSGELSLDQIRQWISRSPEVTSGKWLIQAHLITSSPGKVCGPVVFIRFVTDADGTILQKPAMGGYFLNHLKPGHFDLVYQVYLSMAMPLALTFSFMNCKNVTVQNHEPRALTPREVKAKQRPWVRYKTLDINPMKRVLRAEGGEESNGLKRALHICRGHFANYSEEKPLFGRLSGRFWVPAHVRGSVDSGTIVKDYRVKAK